MRESVNKNLAHFVDSFRSTLKSKTYFTESYPNVGRSGVGTTRAVYLGFEATQGVKVCRPLAQPAPSTGVGVQVSIILGLNFQVLVYHYREMCQPARASVGLLTF